MSEEKNEEEAQKEFPQSATKARELFATIVEEVCFWRNSHLGPKDEMTFELPSPSSLRLGELPEGMVKLIERLWTSFDLFPFPSEDGYYYTIVRAPYWSNGWWLSKKTLVRTKSRDVLNYLEVYDRFLDQYDSLLNREREERKEERGELIQQLTRLEKEEPGTPHSVPLYIIE